MRNRNGITLTDMVVLVALGVVLAGTFACADLFGWEAKRRTSCMNNVRQIGLAMMQYTTENDNSFPKLVDAKGNQVPAVDEKGNVSKEPARSAFAILLQKGYMGTTKVFICPSSKDKVATAVDRFPRNYRDAELEDLILAENQCSYGWDPTKRASANANCALIADKPSKDVALKNEGTAKNNCDNHKKKGQNVWYADGHVKWATTSAPEAGKDKDIYLGGKDYHESKWDAKIIK